MKTIFSLGATVLLIATGDLHGAGYDPSLGPSRTGRMDSSFHAEVRDLSAHDAARNRDIPVRIYLPSANTPAPVVLFSHGLGGSWYGQ